jgi:uncharacterized protein YndB with AHSA1/START domain
MSQSSTESIVREVTIEAPAERIFEALASPEQRAKWWGAEGRFRLVSMESDLRPGGAWVMHFDSNGRATSVRGEYRRIEPPRLLEFTWFNDWQENAQETLVRFELDAENGVTRVRVTHSGLSGETLRAHRGWPDILGWLKAYAEGNPSSKAG